MSKMFNYYDAWQSVELECPKCHWKGTFDEGSVDYAREMQASSCPKCDCFVSPVLAIVSYPTVGQMLASGNAADIQRAKEIDQFQKHFDSNKLMSKDQLPEVDLTSFTLTWDSVGETEKGITVIRHGDIVLFSEPEIWEGHWRFAQVAKIVREKYGLRVIDLVPTKESELYLYGDVSSSITFVANARRTIFGNDKSGVA
jgi:hypothetical protein